LALAIGSNWSQSHAQTQKGSDAPKKKTDDDDDTKEKQQGVVKAASRKVPPAEIYVDPRATAAAEESTARELFPNLRVGPAEEGRFTQMAQGAAGVDSAFLSNYVRYQVSELTRKSNVKAFADLSDRPERAKRISDATEKLVKPFLSPASPQTQSFRRAYMAELLKVVDQVLKNHLYARNAIMIVLKESEDPAAFGVYSAVLKDKSQVLVAKISAAEGIAKAALANRGAIGAQEAARAADALGQFLSDEPDAYWWAQMNALYALGTLRQATSRPTQGRPELAEIALKYLADPKARLDVRANAAWALGMMQVPNQVKSYNYPLVAHQIAQLVVDLETGVAKSRKDDLSRAQHLTKLILMCIEALAGDSDVRNSGIVNADPNAVAPYLEKARAVAIATVEYERAVGVQMPAALKKLNAAIEDLNGIVAGKGPKDRSLVPGGEPVGAAEAPAPAAAPPPDSK
jgi:hypothetical protein